MSGSQMKKTAIAKQALFCVLTIASLCLLASCASTSPRRSFGSGAFPAGFPAPSYSAEDINGAVSTGAFPEAVYIKTRTQTFNTYRFDCLRCWGGHKRTLRSKDRPPQCAGVSRGKERSD
jgi:hypothetical protein